MKDETNPEILQKRHVLNMVELRHIERVGEYEDTGSRMMLRCCNDQAGTRINFQTRDAKKKQE